jgi:hypothetical protein
MSTDLSPDMTEALRRCREAGGLKYVRGGFWIEATADPAPFERLSGTQRLFAKKPLPWSTTSHTIKALVRRGVVREAEKHPDGYLIRVEAT